jgi:hypothetical protein
MKRIQNLFLAAAFLFVTLSQTGCIGSFQLTNNLYNWNKNEVGGKWGSELVFAAFVIIPVYAVALFADGIVLNSIEFWTGSNPITMKAGEKESKIIQSGSDIYQITAEQNKVHVVKLSGENQGQAGEFLYNPQSSEWSFAGKGK